MCVERLRQHLRCGHWEVTRTFCPFEGSELLCEPVSETRHESADGLCGQCEQCPHLRPRILSDTIPEKRVGGIGAYLAYTPSVSPPPPAPCLIPIINDYVDSDAEEDEDESLGRRVVEKKSGGDMKKPTLIKAAAQEMPNQTRRKSESAIGAVKVEKEDSETEDLSQVSTPPYSADGEQMWSSRYDEVVVVLADEDANPGPEGLMPTRGGPQDDETVLGQPLVRTSSLVSMASSSGSQRRVMRAHVDTHTRLESVTESLQTMGISTLELSNASCAEPKKYYPPITRQRVVSGVRERSLRHRSSCSSLRSIAESEGSHLSWARARSGMNAVKSLVRTPSVLSVVSATSSSPAVTTKLAEADDDDDDDTWDKETVVGSVGSSLPASVDDKGPAASDRKSLFRTPLVPEPDNAAESTAKKRMVGNVSFAERKEQAARVGM